MAPGARSQIGAPMLEPETRRKWMHSDEKSIGDIVGTFLRLRSDSAHP